MKQTRGPIYLGSPQYVLGDSVSIDDLGLPSEEISTLKGLGLSHVSRCREPVAMLLQKAIAKVLSAGPAPQAAIIATNSLTGDNVLEFTRMFAQNSELKSVPLLAISAGDCCNLHHAILQAMALVEAGLYDEVLVATVDSSRGTVNGEARAVWGGGVIGDAAAACRIGRTTDRFRITMPPVIVRDTKAIGNPDLNIAHALNGLRSATRGVIPSRKHASSVIQVIPNTHTEETGELVSLATGVVPQRIFTKNVARTGHCFAADNLINLADWCKVEPMNSGPVVMVASGVFQWSACLLDAVQVS